METTFSFLRPAEKNNQRTYRIPDAGATRTTTGYDECMIARHWRGWTKPQDADAYESLLKTKILPQLKKIGGYRGGYIFRKDDDTESEFIVVNFFDSIDAVREFAGASYTVPVFEPEAKRLLARFDSVANHYEVREDTTG